jgi:hypothetical protein
MILVLPAQAVNSGYLLQEQIQEYSGEVNFCGEAALLATANFRSWALSNTYNNPCSLTSNTWSSPAGYLGVNAYGEFNGSYCGQTGWAYNASSTYNFGVGEVMERDAECSLPLRVKLSGIITPMSIMAAMRHRLLRTTVPNHTSNGFALHRITTIVGRAQYVSEEAYHWSWASGQFIEKTSPSIRC